MTSFRTVHIASFAALLVTLAGCSAETANTSGADGVTSTSRAKDTVAAAPAATDAQAAPGKGRHGPPGPDFLLFAALREPIDLTAAQRTAIEGALQANKPSAPPASDKTRASALTTLHATLTPVQRRALVDAIAKRAAEHPDHHAGGPPPDGMRPKGDGPGPMRGLLEGLDLTKAQEDAIRAKLDAQRPAPPTEAQRAAMKQQHEAMRAAMKAKVETFASDTFDANAFVARPAGAPGPGPDHADRFAKDLAAVMSVLDAAQREKLAAKIEAGPPARLEKH
ncbi:MAG: hypothetical protein JWO86_3758 [Myxococcaceae bacterium]|nr:hypothetical protein [Myxococcaceae bacterium]